MFTKVWKIQTTLKNDSAKPNHTRDVQSQPKYYNNLMNSNIVTSRLDLSKQFLNYNKEKHHGVGIKNIYFIFPQLYTRIPIIWIPIGF